MTAYTASVTIQGVFRPERISRNWCMVVGECDLSNYNTTGAEITDITDHFSDTTNLVVLCDPVSENGYLPYWDPTDLCFHASYGSETLAHTHAVALDTGATGAEAAHTHAVALDGGASGAEAAHTHAVALDSGTSAAGSAHGHGVTGVSNAASAVTAMQEACSQAWTKPAIALTHNADPVSNLAAAALYAYEAQGSATENQIYLESTTNGNASILGETADGVGGGVAASCRFWVQDNDSPNGVPIYLNESSSDQLEFVSPTAADGYIIMPFETAAGGMPGGAIKVTVHHNASAATGKALYFDDDGSADAQLCFVDAGASGGTIPAGDIEVILPSYADTGVIGTAAAQALSGTTDNESTHTHGPGTLADAASGAGSSHTSEYGAKQGTAECPVSFIEIAFCT